MIPWRMIEAHATGDILLVVIGSLFALPLIRDIMPGIIFNELMRLHYK